MPAERTRTKDSVTANVRKGAGEQPDDACDMCGTWDGATGRMTGSKMKRAGTHTVGDVTYTKLVCETNPEHTKLLPK